MTITNGIWLVIGVSSTAAMVWKFIDHVFCDVSEESDYE